MGKPIFCRLGLHDFEVVERVPWEVIRDRARYIVPSRFDHAFVIYRDGYVKKVCLDCGKVVDEIEMGIQQERLRIERYHQRKLAAQRLMNANHGT